MVLNYDPNQPRDEDGKWTDTGASAESVAAMPDDEFWDQWVGDQQMWTEYRTWAVTGSGQMMDDDYAEAVAKRLDKLAAGEKPFRGKLYRGEMGVTDDRLESMVQGSTVPQKGWFSASKSPKIARKFTDQDEAELLAGESMSGTNRVIFEIYPKAKTIDLDRRGVNKEQREVLLDGSVPMRVLFREKMKDDLYRVVVQQDDSQIDNYDPNQPRDENGQWTDTGLVSSKGMTAKTIHKHVAAKIAAAAQRIYDDWEQDEDEAEFGGGGICDQIEREIEAVLGDTFDDVEVTVGGQDGDDHAYAVARIGGRVYSIDIPSSVYESGGGYSWKKLPDVEFEPRDVVVDELDVDWDWDDIVGNADPDWDESEHPRDDDGKFTDKGTGSAGGGKTGLPLPPKNAPEEVKEMYRRRQHAYTRLRSLKSDDPRFAEYKIAVKEATAKLQQHKLEHPEQHKRGPVGGDTGYTVAKKTAVYHGTTSAFLESIKTTGLEAGRKMNRVYTAKSYSEAVQYAMMRVARERSGKVAVLTVDIDGLKEGEDYHVIDQYFVLQNTVPPERIKHVDVYDWDDMRKRMEGKDFTRDDVKHLIKNTNVAYAVVFIDGDDAEVIKTPKFPKAKKGVI